MYVGASVLFVCMGAILEGAAGNVSADIWPATSDPDSEIITEDWLALGFGRVGTISFDEPTDFLEAMRHVFTADQFAHFESLARLLGDALSGTVTRIPWCESEGVAVGNPRPMIELDFTIERPDGQTTRVGFSIDRESRQVYMYINHDASSEKSINQTYDERIPMDEAARVAAPFWPLFDLEFALDHIETFFEDSITCNVDIGKDLYGACWVFDETFYYRGFPCRDADLRLRVAADTGVVQSFSYRPIVEPAEVRREISPQTALEILKEKFGREKHTETRLEFDERVLDLMHKIIVLPERVVDSQGDNVTQRPQSRYCWEIPVTVIRDYGDGYVRARPTRAWVDLETGDLL